MSRLVCQPGRLVKAVALEDFVRSLPHRAGYPEPELLTAELLERRDKDPKAPQPKQPVSSTQPVAAR